MKKIVMPFIMLVSFCLFGLDSSKSFANEDTIQNTDSLSTNESVRSDVILNYINDSVLETMLIGSVDKTALTEKKRKKIKKANLLAAGDWDLSIPAIISKANSNSMWIKPYVSYERVTLPSKTKVENTNYGMYIGGDSELYEAGSFDGMFSVYVGYNGSHQAWNGNSSILNGGTLGIENTFFKGNFFDTFSISGGASYGEGDLIYRTRKYKDKFAMINAGIANKIGYNFEFKEGKYILQPNFLMSLSYLLTLNSDILYPGFHKNENLYSLEIEPGVKFIGNIGDTFQYYLSVSMATNFLMNSGKFRAYEAVMPEFSYRPYARYGIGFTKSWKDRFSGFWQIHATTGGRTGIGTQIGCRIKL